MDSNPDRTAQQPINIFKYQPLYARAQNKEDNTMEYEGNDTYQEYADEIAIEHGDYYNTERFRKHLENSPVFEIVDKLSEYEDKLLKRALEELKSKKEWQDLEADDMRHKATGIMPQMSAFELLERYQNKIQRTYKAENWFKDKIDECDRVIAETNTWKTNNKRKANKLKHWRGKRAEFDKKYREYTDESNRYERLIYKWASICEQIKQADIAKEIANEKRGYGNRYGYNPFMQSRETACGIFED